MDVDLKAIELLGQSILYSPDERPQWLKEKVYSQAPNQKPTEIELQALYYRLFWDLAKKYKPKRCLEIGTHLGSACAHLALPNPEGVVVTVDINLGATTLADEMRIPNLRAIHADSSAYFQDFKGELFDLIYVDGHHTFNQAYGEYVNFRQLLRDDGIMFFDDLRLSAEMEAFWEFVGDEKLRLDFLHHTGFGVVRKTHPAAPSPLKEVTAVCESVIQKKRMERLKT